MRRCVIFNIYIRVCISYLPVGLVIRARRKEVMCMDRTGLKRCPLCNSVANYRFDKSCDCCGQISHSVKCNNCPCEVQHLDTKEDAYFWWNRRYVDHDNVIIPISADEAAMMWLIGEKYILDNHPERLIENQTKQEVEG